MSEKFSARECALIAAKAADEHKATDIMVLEVGQLVDVTEYFVIAQYPSCWCDLGSDGRCAAHRMRREAVFA